MRCICCLIGLLYKSFQILGLFSKTNLILPSCTLFSTLPRGWMFQLYWPF
uniref:Uncharacterized protein n=1 Tax=uncultured marine virus TaxID=186617 RepID=A0A0F7L544_9VIRU|nr:hypothetical protein [uncultured marine virus]